MSVSECLSMHIHVVKLVYACVCVLQCKQACLTAQWCPWECPWAESAALCCCIAPRPLSTCRRQDNQTQEGNHYPQHLERGE